MESFKIENLSFAYPNRTDKTLDDIKFTVNQGEFVLLCGKSGCGKTTLLRLLKSSLAPHGETFKMTVAAYFGIYTAYTLLIIYISNKCNTI